VYLYCQWHWVVNSGLLWVLESHWFFSRFSRQGQESPLNRHGPWKSLSLCLKVLESALLLVEGFWGPEICLECVVGPCWPSSRLRSKNPTHLGTFGTSILAPSPIYPSYGPWKSLKNPWFWFLPCDASAERGYEIAFVCLSVCLSVRNDQVPWPHTLEFFENNFTAE